MIHDEHWHTLRAATHSHSHARAGRQEACHEGGAERRRSGCVAAHGPAGAGRGALGWRSTQQPQALRGKLALACAHLGAAIPPVNTSPGSLPLSPLTEIPRVVMVEASGAGTRGCTSGRTRRGACT